MFKNIKNLLISLLTVGKHLFKRPVTLEYPEIIEVIPENFRGIPTVEKCVKCGACMRVCPTGAISIKNNNFCIDLKKCIICGNCSYYCPTGAIKMSDKYETATESSENLTLSYDINMAKVGERENDV